MGGTLLNYNQIGSSITLQNNFKLFLDKLEESTNVHCHHSLIQEDAEQSLKLSITPYTTGVIYLQCYTGLSSEEDCWPDNEQVFVYSKGMVITVSGGKNILTYIVGLVPFCLIPLCLFPICLIIIY